MYFIYIYIYIYIYVPFLFSYHASNACLPNSFFSWLKYIWMIASKHVSRRWLVPLRISTHYFLRHSVARSILNSGRLTKPSAFSSCQEKTLSKQKTKQKQPDGSKECFIYSNKVIRNVKNVYSPPRSCTSIDTCLWEWTSISSTSVRNRF